METPYTAAAIRILTPDEAADRFAFAEVARLASRYPSVAPEFIARLVEACSLANFSLDLAVRRYLDKDRSVSVTPELLEVHRDLLTRAHRVPRV